MVWRGTCYSGSSAHVLVALSERTSKGRQVALLAGEKACGSPGAGLGEGGDHLCLSSRELRIDVGSVCLLCLMRKSSISFCFSFVISKSYSSKF